MKTPEEDSPSSSGQALGDEPGKNVVTLGIDELQNTNGSVAALADVRRWYFADADGKGPTLYFGDMLLEGAEPPAAGAAASSGPVPLVGYKIKGRVGDTNVDLTVTPFVVGQVAALPVTPAQVHGDPARLERIRAAKMPKIERPILFDTPEADAIVSALEVFPPDNPWNLVVDDWPLHPNSNAIIASIGANKKFRYNADMGYVLVPPDQTTIDVKLGSAAAESDKGPYPVPDNTLLRHSPSCAPARARWSFAKKHAALESERAWRFAPARWRHGEMTPLGRPCTWKKP